MFSAHDLGDHAYLKPTKGPMMVKKYRLRFTLHSSVACEESVKSTLAEFADTVCVEQMQPGNSAGSQEFTVSLYTEDPTLVFDACSQVGRIKCVRVEECEKD